MNEYECGMEAFGGARFDSVVDDAAGDPTLAVVDTNFFPAGVVGRLLLVQSPQQATPARPLEQK